MSASISRQQSDPLKPDRSWRQTASIAIPIFHQNAGAQGQFSAVFSSLLLEHQLRLPVFIVRQMEESLMRAMLEYGADDQEPLLGKTKGTTVQLGIHVAVSEFHRADDDSTSAAAAASDHWGFFLVQKRGDQPSLPQLFLDLYLYQE